MDPGCRICENRTGNTPVLPREMMFGTAETFPYFECGGCGCLQIVEVPADLERHYPPGYYSFSGAEIPTDPSWRRWLKSERVRSALSGRGSLDRLLAPLVSVPREIQGWMKQLGASQQSRILDVGCGNGDLLRKLAALGFSSLLGADPFVAGDLAHPDGVVVRKTRLEDLQGQFDAIMLHHSFEHMPDPYAVLKEVKRLLAPRGGLLLRIPLCSCEAYRNYGMDWVQLDAPRHLFLHTERSMRSLAERAGFRVESVVYDSTAFQFWGSEQYRQDIALFSPSSYAVDQSASAFTRSQIDAWERRSRELNAKSDGDQACFALRVAA